MFLAALRRLTVCRLGGRYVQERKDLAHCVLQIVLMAYNTDDESNAENSTVSDLLRQPLNTPSAGADALVPSVCTSVLGAQTRAVPSSLTVTRQPEFGSKLTRLMVSVWP